MMKWLVTQVNKKNKGFTLIEMVVVLAIIAVLIAIAVPQVLKQINNAKKNADIANAKAIATAIMQWVGEGNSIGANVSNAEVDTTNGTVTLNGQTVDLKKYMNAGSYKPKYNTEYKFFVDYTLSDDKLVVKAGKDGGSAKELYPNPDSTYGQ